MVIYHRLTFYNGFSGLACKGAMKLINLLFGFAAILSACQEEADGKFPDLPDGTYHFEIFNHQGRKVLTRDGNAVGQGSYNQVELADPEFISQAKEDSLDVFAALWLFTDKSRELRWDKSSLWQVGPDLAGAFLVQRYYSGPSDWEYESVSGQIRILESTDNVLKGYFRIKMQVRQADDNNLGINWMANPKWGDRIVVDGYFACKGW